MKTLKSLGVALSLSLSLISSPVFAQSRDITKDFVPSPITYYDIKSFHRRWPDSVLFDSLDERIKRVEEGAKRLITFYRKKLRTDPKAKTMTNTEYVKWFSKKYRSQLIALIDQTKSFRRTDWYHIEELMIYLSDAASAKSINDDLTIDYENLRYYAGRTMISINVP